MPQLTLVVVGQNWSALQAFDRQHLDDAAEVVYVDNEPIVSLASIGNHYLENARMPVVGLVHADCVFGPGSLRRFTEVALSGVVCGIVGVDTQCFYRWAGRMAAGTIADVETMDSCSVFLRRDLGLRFDPRTFNDLHCHVEDICMAAHAKRIPVRVPACKCDHLGVSNNAPPWRAKYQPYRDALCQKWGRPIITT